MCAGAGNMNPGLLCARRREGVCVCVCVIPEKAN